MTYCDFGNSEEISTSRLRQLLPQFREHPVQAHQVRLALESRERISWKDIVVGGNYECRVVDFKNDFPLVELRKFSSPISTELGRTFFDSSSSSLEVGLPVTPPIPPMTASPNSPLPSTGVSTSAAPNSPIPGEGMETKMDQSFEVLRNPSRESVNPELDTSELVQRSSSEYAISYPGPLVKDSSSEPLVKDSSSEYCSSKLNMSSGSTSLTAIFSDPEKVHSVLVTYFIGFDKFFIQLKEDCDILVEMMDRLESACSSTSPPPFISRKELVDGYKVAAQYSHDGGWYRAVIVSVKKSDNTNDDTIPALKFQVTVDVFFFDYGNSESYCLTSDQNYCNSLRQLPPKDFCPDLTERPAFAYECRFRDTAALTESLADHILDIELDAFLIVESDDVIKMDLCEIEAVIKQCSKLNEESAVSNVSRGSAMEDETSDSPRIRTSISGIGRRRSSETSCSTVDSNSSTIRLPHAMAGSASLSGDNADMAETSRLSTNSRKRPVSSRSRSLSQEENESSKYDDMNDKMLKDSGVTSCSRFSVPKITSANCNTDTLTSQLAIQAPADNVNSEVADISPSPVTLSQNLSPCNLVDRQSAATSLSSTILSTYSLSKNPSIPAPHAPSMLVSHPVRLAHCQSPTDFYLHLDDQLTELDELSVRILKEVRKASFMDPEERKENAPCLIYFNDQWRRGIFVPRPEKAEQFEKYASKYIFLPDYGNIESLSHGDLYRVPSSLIVPPAFAIPCRLRGFRGGLSPVHSYAFEQIIQAVDSRFHAEFYSTAEASSRPGVPKYRVRLSIDGKDVAQLIAVAEMRKAWEIPDFEEGSNNDSIASKAEEQISWRRKVSAEDGKYFRSS